MAGACSWIAIAQWARTAPQALGICGVSPSAATFRRVLAAVDIAAVEAALTTWVTGRQAHAQAHARAQRPVRPVAECRTVLALDGKTVRAMVAQGDTNRVIDDLWELGARAILVTKIHASRI